VLCAPMRWVWRAFAPELAEQVDRGAASGTSRREADGRTTRVAWTAVSPATLDQVLAPAERTAALEEEAEDRARQPPPPPPPPESRPGTDGGAVALPFARLSYSALESHRRCGYRFFLERVLGLPQVEPPEPGTAPPGAERPEAATGQLALDVDGAPARPPERPAGALDPLVRGSIVHALLERLDFSRPAVPAEPAIAEQIRLHGEDAGPAAVADVRALVQAFVDSPLCSRIAATASVRRELPFAFSLDPGGVWDGEPLLVDGIVDVHAREGDAALVVDYKTDEVGGEDLEPLCADKYGTQRLVYALAALRDGAARVEVVHSFLERPDEPVVARFEAEDAPALESELREMAGALVTGRFQPAGDPHFELCATCPGRPSLCHWPPERTLAPLPPEEAASAGR
jgi:ATP-dependent helicase/nuclease subunit A